MGCGSSKQFELEGHLRPSKSSSSLKRFVTSSKKDEVFVINADDISTNGGGRERLISNSEDNYATVTSVVAEEVERVELVTDRVGGRDGLQKRATLDSEGGRTESKQIVMNGGESKMRILDVPNGFVGEHVAAGWPSWLTAVAGEAVKGWLPRKASSFEMLNKIGQGTYSNVYRARDLETSKIVALKKVQFVNVDPESVRFMAREIYILRMLDHPNIVKLEGLVTSRRSCSLYLVLEYMEHDLAGLAATPGIKFTEPQVKCYMQQLLTGLYHCHSRRVLHRDIKGSNLLIGNNGILKIADFGLATFFNPDQKQPLTSRVVTLWYRPPELLLGATEYAVAVDLWSTGCIFAELLAGRPIMPGRTEVEQLHKIFKLCGSPSEEFWRNSKLSHASVFKPQNPYPCRIGETFGDFPPTAVSLLEILLAIEPDRRGTAGSALMSEFFTTKPFACDPSNLPKYPPSKELDAKLRDEEARRQKTAAIKGNGPESGRREPRELKEMPAADAYADLLKQRMQVNPRSSSEKYSLQEDGGTGFLIEPPSGSEDNGFFHSGTSASSQSNKVKDDAFSSISGRSHGPELKTQGSYMLQISGASSSNLSGFVAARNTSMKLDDQEKIKHQQWPEKRSSSRYNQTDVAETSVTNHLLNRSSSSHKKGDIIRSKDSFAVAHAGKKNRIHFSGPLMPPGVNFDEILKDHERQIQQAVRIARDKVESKSYVKRGQAEAQLISGSNGRSIV